MEPPRRVGGCCGSWRANRDLFFVPVADIDSLLDQSQLSAVHWLTRFTYAGGRIVEIGTYTGGTTVAYGRALRSLGAPEMCLEVYDMFAHNPESRRQLAGEEAATMSASSGSGSDAPAYWLDETAT